jgi:hypothetical protein
MRDDSGFDDPKRDNVPFCFRELPCRHIGLQARQQASEGAFETGHPPVVAGRANSAQRMGIAAGRTLGQCQSDSAYVNTLKAALLTASNILLEPYRDHMFI